MRNSKCEGDGGEGGGAGGKGDNYYSERERTQIRKTLFYKNCSLGSVKPNSYSSLRDRETEREKTTDPQTDRK